MLVHHAVRHTLGVSTGLDVASKAKLGVDPVLDRAEPDLLEPGDLLLGPGRVGDVVERRASPQPQCLPEAAHRSQPRFLPAMVSLDRLVV
jgi:hypothetical protein